MKHLVGMIFLMGALALAGCASSPSVSVATAYPYPHNVYRDGSRLPKELRVVAVLPLAVNDDGGIIDDYGRDTLERVLQAEIARRNAVAVTPVSGDTLQNLTGRRVWRADDVLPTNFFERLRAATGCDAVIFAKLTHYRPYPPLAVGWDVRLVDCVKKRVLWAVDDVFDAGQPGIAAAARRYEATCSAGDPLLAGGDKILMAPRFFGQFAADAAVETMPSY